MLEFEWPWALLLLPLPWLVRKLLPAGESPGLAIPAPGHTGARQNSSGGLR